MGASSGYGEAMPMVGQTLNVNSEPRPTPEQDKRRKSLGANSMALTALCRPGEGAQGLLGVLDSSLGGASL